MSINGLMKTERPMPRDTRTGGVLEGMILPALDNGGYRCKRQVVIGKRLGRHDHKVDVLVSGESDVEIPISLKMTADIWNSGTKGTVRNTVPGSSNSREKPFTRALFFPDFMIGQVFYLDRFRYLATAMLARRLLEIE